MCKLDEDARDGTDGHGDDNGPEPGHGIRRHRIRWNCSVGHFFRSETFVVSSNRSLIEGHEAELF